MGVAAGIAGGGVEFGATQERLDDADIGAAFEQMRCKAMTQHMQCDVLPDPGGVGGLMEEASELPGGHRLAGAWTRLPAWKQPTFLKGCSRNVAMGAASTIAAKVRWRPLREGHGPRLSRRATVARPEDRRRRHCVRFAGLEVDRAGRREVADGGANGSRPVMGY